MKKISSKIVTSVFSAFFFVAFFFSHSTSAQFIEDAKKGIIPVDNGSTGKDASSLLKTIVNTLLFLVGAISVIMIIVGGLRFVISRGDQNAAASARNTVMYAVVGLIVAVVAYGLVRYVLDELY